MNLASIALKGLFHIPIWHAHYHPLLSLKQSLATETGSLIFGGIDHQPKKDLETMDTQEVCTESRTKITQEASQVGPVRTQHF